MTTPSAAPIRIGIVGHGNLGRGVEIAVQHNPDLVNPLTARYLNRLSALLFVLARVANTEHGDSIWRPGNSVAPTSA